MLKDRLLTNVRVIEHSVMADEGMFQTFTRLMRCPEHAGTCTYMRSYVRLRALSCLSRSRCCASTPKRTVIPLVVSFRAHIP